MPEQELDLRDPVLETVRPNENDLPSNRLLISRFNYTDPAGLPNVRKSVADFVSEKLAHPCDPQRLLLTNGADQALCIAIRTICSDPDAEVIIPAPYYYKYPHQVSFFHNTPKIVQAKSNELKFNWEDIEAVISEKTRAIIINNPNNPSGLIYSQAEIAALLQELFAKKIHVILDTVYSSIVFEENDRKNLELPSGLAGADEHLWIVDSLSKSHSVPGWRLGFLYCPQTSLEAAKTNLRFNSSNISTLSQLTFQTVLADKFLPTILIDILKSTRDRLFGLLKENLPDILAHSPMPQAGIFGFLNLQTVSKPAEPDSFQQALAAQKILTRPGSDFGKPGYLRVPLTFREDAYRKLITTLKA